MMQRDSFPLSTKQVGLLREMSQDGFRGSMTNLVDRWGSTVASLIRRGVLALRSNGRDVELSAFGEKVVRSLRDCGATFWYYDRMSRLDSSRFAIWGWSKYLPNSRCKHYFHGPSNAGPVEALCEMPEYAVPASSVARTSKLHRCGKCERLLKSKVVFPGVAIIRGD